MRRPPTTQGRSTPSTRAEHLAEVEERFGPSSDPTGLVELQDRPPEIDVWIDDEGLIRRFHTSESLKDGDMLASTTIDFHYPAGG